MFNKEEISRKDFLKYLSSAMLAFLCVFKLPSVGFANNIQNNKIGDDEKY